MMAELGLPVGAAAVARHYGDILDVFIADEADANEVDDLGMPVRLARTLMPTIEDREALGEGGAGGGRPRCSEMGVWAVVPVKELDRAKERLAPVLPPERRRALMLAMLEDVLAALAAAPGLAGLAVVTVDAAARTAGGALWRAHYRNGARDGHTGAVAAAARLLAAEGCRRHADRARRHSARHRRRDRAAARRASPGAGLHDRPVARRARLERDHLLAARRRAACALARTASSRICGRPRHAASARPCCACRALRSMSTRRRIWPL